MSHGLRHRYTRTLAGRWIIRRNASSTRRNVAASTGADAQPLAGRQHQFQRRRHLAAWPTRFEQREPHGLVSAAVSCATDKTNALRCHARGRTAGPSARSPPARLSACPSTPACFPTPLKYAAPVAAPEERFTRRLRQSAKESSSKKIPRPSIGVHRRPMSFSQPSSHQFGSSRNT